MKKGWNIIVAVVVAVPVVAVGFIYVGVIQSDERSEESRDLEVRDDTSLNETTCSTTGGTWNPCGSACRTDPDAICIELCVEYCECKGDLECPSGYTCGDVVEGVGVCL